MFQSKTKGHFIPARIWASFIILWVFIAPGCGEKSQDASNKPVPPPPTVEKKTSTQQAAVTQKTREVYQWYCTQCHGVEGKGNGINAMLLTVPPRDHTKANYLDTRTDQQLFDAIKLGGLAVGRAPCMPAWEHTLDDETIASLVAYIRELCKCQAL